MVNTALFYNIKLLTVITLTTDKIKEKNRSVNLWGGGYRVEVMNLLSQ